MPLPTEEIKSRLDIVDLIGEYVKLTPGGANWKARCPFHQERSPSFMVSRTKGIFHCFGCGKGGDIFAFLMEMEGLTFGEALRVLAKRANVKLEPRDPQLASLRNRCLDVMKAAVAFTHQLLLKDERARLAREYMFEKRALTEETAELFHVGFTPPEWDGLKRHLLDRGFSEDELFQAGLVVKRQQGTGSYDRFRGRITFPIHDLHGNPIGFGARVLEGIQGPGVSGQGDDAGAKYINTPQTPIYDKSSVLFGIDRAKQDIRREGVAVVVEGYMDCLASHQAGVRQVVASSGTALTEQQVRLLKRFATTVVLAFDADAAGQEAARRGVAQALQQELLVKILTLPKGKDPDELIRESPEAWREAIAAAKPALEHFFDRSFAGRALTSVEDKKAIARELLPLIAMAADPVEQSHYLKRLADSLGVEERQLRERLPKGVGGRGLGAGTTAATLTGASAATPPVRDRRLMLSERLLAIVLRFPDELALAAERVTPSALAGEGYRRLYEAAIVWYTEHQQFDPAGLRASYISEPTLQQLIDVVLLLADQEFPTDDPLAIRRELSTVVSALQRHALQDRLTAVTKRMQESERDGARAALETAQAEWQELTDELKRLG